MTTIESDSTARIWGARGRDKVKNTIARRTGLTEPASISINIYIYPRIDI